MHNNSKNRKAVRMLQSHYEDKDYNQSMRYIALLRGINVGGNHRVEMKRLKALYESLGMTDVSTYINSGNVLFESPEKDIKKLTIKLEDAMEKEFGFRIPTVLRSKNQILKLVKEIPSTWTNDTEQKCDILFLWEDFDNEKSLTLISPREGVDTVKYIAGAIIWNLDRKHYTKSGIGKIIGTAFYKGVTVRNVNTVRKLASLVT